MFLLDDCVGLTNTIIKSVWIHRSLHPHVLVLMLLIVRGYEHSIFFILNLSCLVKECSALLQPVSEWSSTLEDSLDVTGAATNLTTDVISSLN